MPVADTTQAAPEDVWVRLRRLRLEFEATIRECDADDEPTPRPQLTLIQGGA